MLTIHLFVPMDPAAYRAHGALDEAAVDEYLRFYAEACAAEGVTPLIENVPPVLRMRTGGVYLSPVGGHWRDLQEWCARVPGLRVTFDTSHAALFATFAAAYPSLFGLASDDGLDLPRYADELLELTDVAHVSDAHGLLGEGLPYGTGELDLDPVVRRLGERVPYIVAEINEPDPAHSEAMKAGYREVERALAAPADPPRRRSSRIPPDPFDWQAVVGRRDPVPAVLELQEAFGGRRVLITGGGGWIGGRLASLLLGFRPERVTLLDSHEASLTADRRSRSAEQLERMEHTLGDIRDGGRLAEAVERVRPDAIFHLAAYKHVDWAETHPQEFVDTNLQGSWNVLRAAEASGVGTVVVASTDKAALAACFYGRTKRFMEQLTAHAAARRRLRGAPRQRAGQRRLRFRAVPAPVARRRAADRHRHGHDALLDHGRARGARARARRPAGGRGRGAGHAPRPRRALRRRAGRAHLARRRRRRAGRHRAAGIRRGETMSEVLTGPGEQLGPERHQGIAAIEGGAPSAGPAWVAERLDAGMSREAARAVWLEAMRPGCCTRRTRGGGITATAHCPRAPVASVTR